MLKELWREAREIWSEDVNLVDLTDPSRAGARLRSFLLLVRETFRNAATERTFSLASALAFKTLVALVPLLAISLAIVTLLEPPGGAAGVPQGSYTESFLRGFQEKLPDFAGREDFLASVRGFAQNARAVLGVGFVFLFGVAFSLLTTMEAAFNGIWQVRANRPFFGRLGAFLSTILIVPILMSLSVYFATQVTYVTESVAQGLGPVLTGESAPPAPPPAAGRVGAATPEEAARLALQDGDDQSRLTRYVLLAGSVLTTIAALTALLYLLPNTPVRLRAALAGGILSGLLFEGAKSLFRHYAAYLAVNYTKIYGPLLAVPFVLLWLWLVWVIILFGVEVAFVAQNFRDLAARAEVEKRGLASRLYLAVRVMLAASDRFHRGEDPAGMIERVCEELRVPPYVVRQVVLTLVEGRMLRRLGGSEEAYVPARDIGRLTVSDVVRAVASDALDVPSEPEDDAVRRRVAELFARAEKAEEAVLGGPTFAELVAATEKRGRENPPDIPGSGA
ncbi:MAG: YhjD/YihY/BrkB family envelope integrity protein [Planctomycetota bacterium]